MTSLGFLKLIYDNKLLEFRDSAKCFLFTVFEEVEFLAIKFNLFASINIIMSLVHRGRISFLYPISQSIGILTNILQPSNPFLVNVLILHLLKTPENRRFSSVFRGYKMGTLTRNWLRKTWSTTLLLTEISDISIGISVHFLVPSQQ